jgi:pimeloyl-ACP methyl ester carboxylesterase
MNWLFLRGLARERRHWHDFPGLFAARRAADRVYLLDVAGVGTEHRVRPRPCLGWLARDLGRRLQALPVPDDGWSLVGLSLGGMLCLELCRLYPDRIRQAVVINASSRLSPLAARLRPSALARLMRVLCSPEPRQREHLLLQLTSSLPADERHGFAERAAAFAGDAPVRRSTVMQQLIAAARFYPPDPRSVRARLLFLASSNDALVDPLCTRDLARHYAGSHAEHPSAGHDLPLDDPAWLCERLARFSQ